MYIYIYSLSLSVFNTSLITAPRLYDYNCSRSTFVFYVFEQFWLALKGLCQLESMRSEVMQITFNCQNSIVFNARLHVLCHLEGSEFREVNKRNGFR